jgi:two-component system cell cycle sensor histidine kinase/response regulator CckA
LENTKIMVVEDNPITRKMVKLALRTEGYQVLEAEDGRTALEIIDREKPDLILQDLRLPDMTGFDLAREYRSRAGFKEIPIIAVTGLLFHKDKASAESLRDFTSVLTKPIEPSKLILLIKGYLAERKVDADLPGKGLTVLVVDDDQSQGKLLKLTLEGLGFNVRVASDGAEALKAAKADPPDIVVSDVLMPRMDGFQLCLALRDENTLPLILIFLITSIFVEQEDLRIAEAVGATALLVRNENPGQVAKAILERLKSDEGQASDAVSVQGGLKEFLWSRQMDRLGGIYLSQSRRLALLEVSLGILTNLASTLNGSTSETDLLQELLPRGLDAAGLSYGAVFLLSPGGKLSIGVKIGMPDLTETSQQRYPEIFDLFLRTTGKGDTLQLPAPGANQDSCISILKEWSMKSLLVSPIRLGKQNLGFLLLGSETKAMTQDWMGFGDALGCQIAQFVLLMRTMGSLSKAEGKYGELVEHANVGILQLNPSGTILDANSRFEEMTGYRREELKDKPLNAFVNAKDQERVSSLFRKLLNIGSYQSGEVGLIRESGDILYTEISASTVETGGSTVFAIVKDITRRKISEQLMAAQYAVTRGLGQAADIEAAGQAILDVILVHLKFKATVLWLKDKKDGMLRYFAGKCESPFLPESDFGPALPGSLPKSRQGFPRRNLAKGESEWISELSAAKDGMQNSDLAKAGYRTVVGIPIMHGGRTLGVLDCYDTRILARDDDVLGALESIGGQLSQFMERKRAEEDLDQSMEQLRQAQKMEALGHLAGGVAHDFNNLLGVILGYSELLIAKLPEEDMRRSHVEQILKAGDRAQALTRQLLTFSRKQVVHPAMINFNAVIMDMKELLGRLVNEDVECIYDLEPAPLWIFADPGQGEQIIMNLAVNARDAMPDGGKLMIATRNVSIGKGHMPAGEDLEPGNYFQVKVTDQGSGMSEEVKARLFEPFFTSKGIGQGTGLGLSSVYGIVAQYRGRILVESELGKGSTFTLYFPGFENPAEAPEAAPYEDLHLTGTETLLIVEDQEEIRGVLREMLQGQGYRVMEAQNGSEALIFFSGYAGQIDLVITDMVMPSLNGTGLARALREIKPDVKIMFMSGYPDRETEAIDPGCAGTVYLQKPFRSDLLFKRIRAVLHPAPQEHPSAG